MQTKNTRWGRAAAVLLALGLALTGCPNGGGGGGEWADPGAGTGTGAVVTNDPVTYNSGAVELTIARTQADLSRAVITPRNNDWYKLKHYGEEISRGTITVNGQTFTFKHSSGDKVSSDFSAGIDENGTLTFTDDIPYTGEGGTSQTISKNIPLQNRDETVYENDWSNDSSIYPKTTKSGKVYARIGNNEVEVGAVTNGKLSITLPPSAPSGLGNFSSLDYVTFNWNDYLSTISDTAAVNPANSQMIRVHTFILRDGGNSYFMGEADAIRGIIGGNVLGGNGTGNGWSRYLYVNQNCTITGITKTSVNSGIGAGQGMTFSEAEFNLTLEKGWNRVYFKVVKHPETSTLTTEISNTPITSLRWGIRIN